jgi:hypothetical protein
VYRGALSPIRAGSAARSHVADLPEQLASLELPVTITVFPDEGGEHTVLLADDLGLLFGAQGRVGTLTYTSTDGWTLDLPAFALVETPSSSTPVEVWVPDVRSPVQWEQVSLSTSFTTSFEGVTRSVHSPYLEWSITAFYAEPIADGTITPVVPEPFEPTLDPARAADVLSVEQEVRDALLDALTSGMITSDGLAASALMCTPAEAATPTLLGESVLEISGTPVASGDLACTGGTAPFTFPVMGSNLLTVNENVAHCLADLDRIEDAAGGDPLALLVTDGCVDGSRVIAALGHALEAERVRGLGTGSGSDELGTTLGLRLLQQWLAMHTLISRDAFEIQGLNDILASAERVEQVFDVPGAVQAGISGWDLLLHPRTGVPLGGADDDCVVLRTDMLCWQNVPCDDLFPYVCELP